MQDDILYDSFTPREALTFAARLKLQGTEDQQNERVEELLTELGLNNVAETVIGSVMMKTISGGERKRTAIGVELVTDPSLILLDEPTSGLDSFKALQIVRLLERQAKKGKTVISTIHQPSSDAFAIFDRLILMMDGYVVYQGRAKDSTSYFATIGFQCPTRSNPADYFMKVLTVNYPKAESDEAHISNLFDHYNKSLAP
jgi:ABC-type multidrug transport system ATPase subunit